MKNQVIDKEIRVLVITSIIPTELIDRKKNENDILFTTEDAIKKQRNNIKFQYLFTVPKTGFLLSFLSSKWKAYYKLEKQGFFYSRERKIIVFPQIILPVRLALRKLYFGVGLYFYRHYLDRILRDFNPTIIHAQNVDSNAFIARWIKRKYGIPYIITLRESRNIDSLIKKNLKRANFLIALTPNEGNDKVFRFNGNYKIIPHGVSADSYDSDQTQQKEKEDRFRIISVCRLLPFKNIHLVLYKLNEIKDKIDFEYKIYGDGPEYESLEKLIYNLELSERVSLEGKISHKDVKREMKKADIFVLLSYPETFGRVFVESMASGLPFIGLKNTGIYGMVENGVESFFCEEANFLDVLTSCYHNQEFLSRVGDNARLAAERFKLENVANDLVGVYSKNQILG